jgi:phosphatidylserine/phosphatidylglycerophosphate/cardiolipin synthase-like enzyme
MRHDVNYRTGIFLLLCSIQAFPSPADAVYIPARDYFSTLTSEINKARSSVIAAVYLFALYPDRSQAQTTKLADALCAAKKRGCTVRVVLDKGESSDAGDVNANNRMAFEYLKVHGIDAYFADVPAVMHAKAVILDSGTVIMGSANWSEAAFQKNTEAGGLIRSKEVAVAALDELGKIPTTTLQDQDTCTAFRST